MLLVGLGNPGQIYEKTRHNLGAFLLNVYVAHKGGVWYQDVKYKGEMSVVTAGGRKIFCLKPQTFMNQSGESVQALCAYFKIPATHVMVICDDISIPFGEFKVSIVPGDAGHKGIKSIAAHIGKDFMRYRVGLGTKPTAMTLNDYVLGKFSEAEQGQLPKIAAKFEENMEVMIDKGVLKGLNLIGRKKF